MAIEEQGIIEEVPVEVAEPKTFSTIEGGYTPTISDKEFDQIAGDSSRSFAEADISEGASAAYRESFISGAVGAGLNAASYFGGDRTMTPEEANEKYGLGGTPVAFEGDRLVSDSHAKHVLRNHVSEQINNQKIKMVDEQYGMIGKSITFLSALGGGITEPVNIATSFIGGAGVITKLAAKPALAIFREILTRQTVPAVMLRQLTENFVASGITEVPVYATSKTLMNRTMSAENAIFNTMGSIVLGTGIGGLTELGSIRMKNNLKSAEVAQAKEALEIKDAVLDESRRKANAVSKSAGSKGPKLVTESLEHGTLNVANNKKPNMNHKIKLNEMDAYLPRPGQTPHIHRPISTRADLGERRFYISESRSTGEVDVVSSHGESTVLSENYNLVHNRVEPAINDSDLGKGKPRGSVTEARISDDANIVTDENFNDARVKLTAKLLTDPNTHKIGKVIRGLDREITNMTDLVTQLHEGTSNFKGMGSLDDIINGKLKDGGYQGYLSKNKAMTMEGTENNILVVLDDTALEFGSTNPTTRIDPKGPEAAEYYKPLRELEQEEIARQNSATEDLDYDPSAEDLSARSNAEETDLTHLEESERLVEMSTYEDVPTMIKDLKEIHSADIDTQKALDHLADAGERQRKINVALASCKLKG